jgi:xanthine dehydrogenase YagS FAD-binding subunit
MTALRPGEILTAVRLPSTWRGATFYFEKVADRAVWDFALLSVAAAFRQDGDRVSGARIVCGAVACVPWRLDAVEKLLVGNVRDEDVAGRAGKLAVEGAHTLNFNHFKVALMENLVRRAIRDA